jgi:hypothetical protein
MAEWDTAYINDLPDSAFAVILPGGTKDSEGKTTPRSLRKLPHHAADGSVDAPHLRNALSRAPQTDLTPAQERKAESHLEAHMAAMSPAKAKALMPVKAQQLDPDEDAAFWAGKIPRRLLAVPFGGPIPHPSAPKGMDIDGEWFSERTDIFGDYRILRQNRERLVDFNHAYLPPHSRTGDVAKDPTGRSGMMTGHILGKSILDPDPDEDGWWVDFWVEAGNKRVRMVKALADRGAQLFGSTQPIKARYDDSSGEILYWPWALVTLSTSPQNTYAVIRPKAMLEELDDAGATGSFFRDLRVLMADLATQPDTDLTSEVSAKAGRVLAARNEAKLLEAIAAVRSVLDELDKYMEAPAGE